MASEVLIGLLRLDGVILERLVEGEIGKERCESCFELTAGPFDPFLKVLLIFKANGVFCSLVGGRKEANFLFSTFFALSSSLSSSLSLSLDGVADLFSGVELWYCESMNHSLSESSWFLGSTSSRSDAFADIPFPSKTSSSSTPFLCPLMVGASLVASLIGSASSAV